MVAAMGLSPLETVLWDESDLFRKQSREAERVVVALRRLLIGHDAGYPSEYDGEAWAVLERGE